MPIKHGNRAKVTISSRWDVSKARLIIAAFLHVWNDAHCHHALLTMVLSSRKAATSVIVALFPCLTVFANYRPSSHSTDCAGGT
jgi:hypothetical protein